MGTRLGTEAHFKLFTVQPSRHSWRSGVALLAAHLTEDLGAKNK